ncbi:acyltransferase, putative [Labilithrix luteola]|uniref:Acyltransferase, putative n=1 Tax=Labilithrix luteola TaxID=1391654 RepID=A0A0K1PQI2_9BACT|nr:lysophospholipid acyltransferase family protein [Labilithrix luteola]AKU95800.1 acyltransferase, putative [Labilithrix luteola]
MPALKWRDRLALEVQSLLGWAAFAIVGPSAVFTMRVARGNRVEGIAEARRVYREALASGRPTLVCANHLTMVDSAFLHHALAPLGDYLRDFHRFSWNVPATEHFTKNLFLRVLVYLAKCVPIDRAGDTEARKAVLDRLAYLVSRGEIVTLFPEGGRSRTGRVDVDNVTYGVGQILSTLDRPQVFCAYLRGDRQDSYSTVPAFGDTLRLRVAILEPTTNETGLRAARDLSRQVIAKLKVMENDLIAEREAQRVSGDRDEACFSCDESTIFVW